MDTTHMAHIDNRTHRKRKLSFLVSRLYIQTIKARVFNYNKFLKKKTNVRELLHAHFLNTIQMQYVFMFYNFLRKHTK